MISTMDDDSWIEQEIASQLNSIDIIDQDNDAEVSLEDEPLSQASSLGEQGADEILGSMQEYVRLIQQQSNQLETELQECNDLLHESGLVSARTYTNNHDGLEALALEEGVDVQTLKNKVLLELEEEDARDRDDDAVNQKAVELINTSCHPAFITTEGEPLFEAIESKSDDVSDKTSSKIDVTVETSTVAPENMAVIEVTESDRLEEELRGKLREMEDKCQKRNLEKENEYGARKLVMDERQSNIETKRKERQDFISAEGERLAREKTLMEGRLKEEAAELEKEMKEAFQKYQIEINELTLQVKLDTENLEATRHVQHEKMELKRREAALRIQRTYRGHRVRKVYGKQIEEKRIVARKKMETKRIAEIQKEREGERKKKEVVEMKRKEEEERMKKEREEELERMQKEELRKEEERLKKEEEKRKKEEEKKRKEEERKRNEEEKRKKEEEQKKKEEERKRKDEEKRLEKEQKEAETHRLKEEAERKMREEEERKMREEEEKKKREEEEKQEEERKTKEKEEMVRKENERKQREEADERRKIEAEKKRQEEVVKKQTENKFNHAEEIRKRVEDKRVEENVKQRIVNGREISVEHWGDFMPESLEKRRLQWMKNCMPWSKSVSDLKSPRSMSSKSIARRPFSAKGLQEFESSVILSAANVATLQQVSTVSLHDLPGRRILKPFDQCSSLCYLYLHKCGVVSVDSLQSCKNLLYASFKKNQIEAINLINLSSLTFLDLSHNMLTSIHGLDGCSNLLHLNLDYNKITRLGGLATLKHLHTLRLSHNQLISTKGVGDAASIQCLDISHNHLSSVTDIDRLGILQTLDASNNNLMQAPLFTNQVLLSSLDLSDNSISSVAQLSHSWLPLLRSLNLARNSVVTLDPLNACISLENLDLTSNQIIDVQDVISSLRKCRSLKALKVYECPFAEDPSVKKALMENLSSLLSLDDVVVSDGNSALRRIQYEIMCENQLKSHSALVMEFQSLQKVSKSLSETCKYHWKFYTCSHQMAVEHRYIHEYGDVTPEPPSTPRLLSAASARSSKPTAPPPTQANQMKNKFELALQGVNGSEGQRSMEMTEIPRERLVARVMPQPVQPEVQINANTIGQLLKKDQEQPVETIERQRAATIIQATWRGYYWRKRLTYALAYAREYEEVQPVEDDEDMMEYGEVDLDAFNFNEDDFEKGWVAPPTPRLPQSHPIISRPNQKVAMTQNQIESKPLSHATLKQAWRNADSPLSNTLASAKPPLPPLSRMSDLSSDIHTQRSGLSKKEEKITEEWGFKDSKTAELMLARAKKLKYNALNKKKLSQLDAHQRLALMRKLEENARLRPVQPPGRSGLPRKEYFQAKERESNYKHMDEQQENTAKVTRTFEWVHMQVGDHGPPSKLTSGAENLPHMDPTVLAGRRGLLTGSPISLDLQSVDSRVSGEIYVKPRRMSFQEPGKHERLPPIKATSAPATKKLLDEKISRRTQPVNQSVGWGGGRKLQK